MDPLARHPTLAMLLAAGAAACNDPTLPPAYSEAPAWLRPGVIQFYDQPVRIAGLTGTRVGDTLRLTVTTYGGGCHHAYQTAVSLSHLHAQIFPLDSVAGRFCTDILAPLSHPAVLVPTERGFLTVAVTGMREPGSQVLTVSRTVVVR